MSWRTGAELFWEIWPLIEARIPEDDLRYEFGKDLLTLCLDSDVAPGDIEGQHPEIDRMLKEVGPELP